MQKCVQEKTVIHHRHCWWGNRLQPLDSYLSRCSCTEVCGRGDSELHFTVILWTSDSNLCSAQAQCPDEGRTEAGSPEADMLGARGYAPAFCFPRVITEECNYIIDYIY